MIRWGCSRIPYWAPWIPDAGNPVAHPLFHARSSARKYGGIPPDYQAIHDWFDESKAFLADVRHRALRHHAEGIFLCEKIFGTSIVNSDGREVPVRFIGEQHVLEDLGRIPAASDWLREISLQPWMTTRSQLQSPEPVEDESSTGSRNALRQAIPPTRSARSADKM